MTGSHFGIVPRRVARLRLPRRALNVLIAIASRANRDRITPPLSRDDIASEVGIDRSKVGLCVRKLKENGVLELVVEGGGRGRANVYRIIPDEEASAPLMNGAAAGPETSKPELPIRPCNLQGLEVSSSHRAHWTWLQWPEQSLPCRRHSGRSVGSAERCAPMRGS
jgi:biotin operon repressor